MNPGTHASSVLPREDQRLHFFMAFMAFGGAAAFAAFMAFIAFIAIVMRLSGDCRRGRFTLKLEPNWVRVMTMIMNMAIIMLVLSRSQPST